MTDRELLELAAKAAGSRYVLNSESHEGRHWLRLADGRHHNWNPLADDGDAFRLAVHLQMTVTVDAHGYTICEACIFDKGIFPSAIEYHKETDSQTATRRAVVRAAAEIGRAMS